MKFLIGIFIIASSGCSTSYKNQSSKETFDLIKLGDTPDAVIRKVGEPQQKNDKFIESKWYYFSKNQKTLKLEVSFSESKKVESLIVYPQQEGNEDELNAFWTVDLRVYHS